MGSVVTPVNSAPTCSGSPRHVVGYKAEWETEFSWLQAVRDETGLTVGVLCCLCKLQRTNTTNPQNGVRVPAYAFVKTVFVVTA